MSERPRCWITDEDPVVVAARLREPDGLVVDGDAAALPAEPFDLTGFRVLLTATIADHTPMEPLLTAASRGVSLVIRLKLTGRARARRLDELGRMAVVLTDPLDPAAPGSAAPTSTLTGEQLQLLSLVAAGVGLDAAAARLGIGRRTAYRRLAAAQQALGAASKVDAVQRARRAGLLPSGPPSPGT